MQTNEEEGQNMMTKLIEERLSELISKLKRKKIKISEVRKDNKECEAKLEKAN